MLWEYPHRPASNLSTAGLWCASGRRSARRNIGQTLDLIRLQASLGIHSEGRWWAKRVGTAEWGDIRPDEPNKQTIPPIPTQRRRASSPPRPHPQPRREQDDRTHRRTHPPPTLALGPGGWGHGGGATGGGATGGGAIVVERIFESRSRLFRAGG